MVCSSWLVMRQSVKLFWWYLCLSIYLYYLLIIKRNHFSNISLSLMGYPGVFDAWHRYSLCNSLTPGCQHTWYCPLGKCTEMVYSIMLRLMTLTLWSVYCLFYYAVWFDFMPINITFVYKLLPMDSEND